ncbi:hypothetical protein SARC_01637 [Sphaeroforma arctica JP610]|uniref:EGF-like domain-containing protein n=1 Tax=Sphaeroforma arctica JP610 TaxID=667725 RepID=A0A0L0GB23_9EUKA|nr:hypothetical protein SARC_01637 [Sphaeroforma arctica JP610]KNC86200.1 hypothetical protein SARC_01637 [Sphaeroforma arctica JP610]|eukprot:XP_014160102.1 hypothetical protein SARC_01637 [Sphaeroforma arctica JP610]
MNIVNMYNHLTFMYIAEQTRMNVHSARTTCGNIDGSYTCTYNSGYAGSGTTCEDVNECLAGADNYDMNAICTNTVGSFECTCDEFHIGDGVTCIDKDECALDTHNCHSNATCTNTDGGFTCACNSGYTGIGHTCTDINKCLVNTHNCDENAQCTNTDGSFECACDEFWTGDGLIYTDIDECDSAAIIECENEGDTVVCVNHVGADYTCECNPTGYRDPDNSDGFNCVAYAGDPAKCADYHLAANCPDGTLRNSGNQGNCDPERGCAESCCTADQGYVLADDDEAVSLISDIEFRSGLPWYFHCLGAYRLIECAVRNCQADTTAFNLSNGQLESALDTSAPNAFSAGDELDNCPTTADTDGLGTVGEWMIRTSLGSSTNRAFILIVLPDNNPTNELAAYIYDIRQRQGSGEFNPFTSQWYISSYD